MCFIVNKRDSKVRIATEDITCYKILSSDHRSVLSPEPILYEVGIRQPTVRLRKTIQPDVATVIEKGYHSYRKKSMTEVTQSLLQATELLFNSGINIKCFVFVFAFTIPRGARYYQNADYYVSNTIIMNQINNSEDDKKS